MWPNWVFQRPRNCCSGSGLPGWPYSAPGYCWIDGSIYKLKLRDNATGANYTSFCQAYLASHTLAITSTAGGSSDMAAAISLRVGEMSGYADVIDGYPAYIQPALAYSVDSGDTQARTA